MPFFILRFYAVVVSVVDVAAVVFVFVVVVDDDDVTLFFSGVPQGFYYGQCAQLLTTTTCHLSTLMHPIFEP